MKITVYKVLRVLSECLPAMHSDSPNLGQLLIGYLNVNSQCESASTAKQAIQQG